MGLLIRNGIVVSAEKTSRADILIEGAVIREVRPGIQPEAGHQVLDAAGMLLLPGGIDAHTHLDMPFGGSTSSDDFETGTRAAAIGGTTTIIDFAIQARGTKMRAALDTWWKKAESRASRIRVPRAWMAKSIIVVVPPMAAARVPLSKSSLDVEPPNGISRCVCASMPPGSSSIPVASSTSWAASGWMPGRTSRIACPSINMSAWAVFSADTTVPFRMSNPISSSFRFGLRVASGRPRSRGKGDSPLVPC